MNNIIYYQKDFPVFQQVLYKDKDSALNCDKVDILLEEDSETGIIFNSSFDQNKANYDVSYSCEQSISTVFQTHLLNVEKIIEENIGKENIIEIGCGKGYFLEYLNNRGFDIIGFDPAYEGSNPKIQKKYFEPNSEIIANGIILRHVLEHIKNPFNFLEILKNSNKESGKIYIEVPCLDWILEHNAFYDIFYEHVNYFRLTDFENFFDKIIDSGKCFNGQYIYVIAELSSLRIPKIDINYNIEIIEKIKKISPNMPISNKINIWGGASKGVIFSILCQRNGIEVQNIIDINPNKQNMFTPVSGILIKSPEYAINNIQQGSEIFVMNSNYLKEIEKITSNRFILRTID